MWCHMPVVLAAWEAEAGELLEPWRWWLQWATITPLHSNLGNKSETPSQRKNKKKQYKTQYIIPGAGSLLDHFSFRKRFEQQQKLLEEERKRRQFEEQKQKLRLLSSVKPKVMFEYF